MNYAYSATVNAFYDVSLMDVYKENGNWPSDCKEVPDEVFMEFRTGSNSEGKVRGSGSNGMPQWIDPEPPSDEFLVVEARDKRDTLMAMATKEIAPLQDAVDTDDATTEELTLLTKWKIFRRDLGRLEGQDGWPRNIEWPEQP